jgi:hypothetical protein
MQLTEFDVRRSGRVVATILWVVVAAAFVVLFVLDASGWAWLVYIGSCIVGVGLVGLLRQVRTDVEITRRGLVMVLVATMFPQVDRLLRHDEEVRAIGEQNANRLDCTATLLERYYLGRPPAELEQRCAMPSWYSTPVPVDVPTATRLAAEGLSDAVRAELVGADTTTIADALCVLYWAEFAGSNAQVQANQLFCRRKREIIPVLATLLTRRDDLRQVRQITDDEFVHLLEKQAGFDLDLITRYATDPLPGVGRRMLQILESYAPTDRTVPWPTADLTALQAEVSKSPPALAAQISAVATYCSNLIAAPSPTAGLLDFLYRRRFDPKAAIAAWSRKDERFRRELAQVLARSELLTGPDYSGTGTPTPTFGADVDAIQRILDALSEYSLPAVRAEIVELDHHLRDAENLHRFLGCIDHSVVDRSRVLDVIERTPPRGLPARADDLPWLRDVSVSRAVLVSEARSALGGASPSLTDAQRDTLSLIAVGEFVVRSNDVDLPHLSSFVARCAAGGDAARYLFTLLVDRAQGRIGGSTICEVLAGLPQRTRPDAEELVRRLDELLEIGEWPRALPVVPGAPTPGEAAESAARTGADVADELQLLRADVGAVRASVESSPSAHFLSKLRRHLAGEVPWPTTEFDRLYLITFGSRHGPLGALIDVLTSDDAQCRRRLRELQRGLPTDEPAPCLDELFERVDDGYYQFTHYTHYARAGRVAAGESFEAFATTLFDDLSCLIKLTDHRPDFTEDPEGDEVRFIEWEDIEVNLLSLGFPIRYDLWREDVPGLRRQASLEHAEKLAGDVGAEALEPLATHRPR